MYEILCIYPETKYEKNNLSPNPVDIFSLGNIFLETDIAQGRICKSKRSGLIHNFTMGVDPGYKYIKKYHSGLSWYMIKSEDFVWKISFKFKNEKW